MSSWTTGDTPLRHTDATELANALLNARINYGIHKQKDKVELRYIYMSEAVARNSVKAKQFTGDRTVSDALPHAVPNEMASLWFIAVDSNTDLNGQIEVVVWGSVISA